ncbi:MAG: metallophosphoesterase [Bacteroidaceae bacterium]|nr:metallophosphoesterase [Bacteroidaceae bacterium]
MTSADVPQALDGYRIAFATDFHLASKFKERQLQGAVKALEALKPDVIMLGGDYQEGCEYVEPLFAALGSLTPPDGIYAVLGNNDFERCTDEIILSMQRHGIRLLDYTSDTLHAGLVVVGAPYCTHPPLMQPLADRQHPDDYVIFLTHSPDIVESAALSPEHIDLALAGHTHGGQITFFYIIAPETGSRYGRRFLYGRRRTSRGVPVIVSRGLGTSRVPIRFCAPTDITLVTLRALAEPSPGRRKK